MEVEEIEAKSVRSKPMFIKKCSEVLESESCARSIMEPDSARLARINLQQDRVRVLISNAVIRSERHRGGAVKVCSLIFTRLSFSLSPRV